MSSSTLIFTLSRKVWKSSYRFYLYLFMSLLFLAYSLRCSSCYINLSFNLSSSLILFSYAFSCSLNFSKVSSNFLASLSFLLSFSLSYLVSSLSLERASLVSSSIEEGIIFFIKSSISFCLIWLRSSDNSDRMDSRSCCKNFSLFYFSLFEYQSPTKCSPATT